MRIGGIRLVGIRCFEDTGDIVLAKSFNLIVGQNNSGKSTFLRGVLHLQGPCLDANDIRPQSPAAWLSAWLTAVNQQDAFANGGYQAPDMRVMITFQGNHQNYNDFPLVHLGIGHLAFHANRPLHHIVPFLAKRKASGFSEAINQGAHSPVNGTLQDLYANIDVLATAGHPKHQDYLDSVIEVLGLTITTRASGNGKVAGFYLDQDNFITLDRMGDGVTEIVALITELCLSRNKIFVLEEPETNLHPKGLKALLELVRRSAEHNQFIIATHSNVVVRELGADEDSKVFRVYRDGDAHDSPSRIEEVERHPAAHHELLRELGYEFTDLNLHDGWLFLEESSAERVVRDILIPTFVPELRGRLRTFSAAGVTNLEPSVAEFRRLITFVHLEPAYEGRLWVRADGDQSGQAAVEKMNQTFPNMGEDGISTFQQPQFENYYPADFADEAQEVLAIVDKKARRMAKTDLLQKVLAWTDGNPYQAKLAWEASAQEVIALLKMIAKKIK